MQYQRLASCKVVDLEEDIKGRLGKEEKETLQQQHNTSRNYHTYSSVMTSPPDSSFTARQNSRELSTSFQILEPTIFVLSTSIKTVRVSKGEPTVVVDAVVATSAVTAVSALQSALAYSSTVGGFPVPITYVRTTSLLVELVVKSTATS